MEKDDYLKKLGKHIAAIREKAGLSQSELAAKFEKDRQNINRLEKGGINPTIYYLKELAEQLEVSLKDLIDF